jgi:hypothetical protein
MATPVDAAGWRLVPPHSNTALFVAGLIFAAADAFGIGSNDVANSFATSVGSGSLTLRAACGIAVFTEFGGAMLLGDRVTKTIKGGCGPPVHGGGSTVPEAQPPGKSL